MTKPPPNTPKVTPLSKTEQKKENVADGPVSAERLKAATGGDRLGIGGIILLPLNERLHKGGRNHPHIMAQPANLPRQWESW